MSRARRGTVAIAALALFEALGTLPAAPQNPGILGVWWTDKNEARVEISACAAPSQGLCGTIIWLSQPKDAQGRPRADRSNANPTLRSRLLLGLRIFEGWRPAGPNKWKGAIYVPDEGQSFDVDISLAGDKLTIKGCVVFLCDSDTWNRYKGS
jgi:uncharacterized protein (DUF2147 family)